ncbi:MAG: hypothetical protein U0892_01200 [Pirellulales bacterium]
MNSWRTPLAVLSLNALLVVSILAYRLTGAASPEPPATDGVPIADPPAVNATVEPAKIVSGVQVDLPNSGSPSTERIDTGPNRSLPAEALPTAEQRLPEDIGSAVPGLPAVPSLEGTAPKAPTALDPQISAMVAAELDKYAKQEGISLGGNLPVPPSLAKPKNPELASMANILGNGARARSIAAICQSIELMSEDARSLVDEDEPEEAARIMQAVSELRDHQAIGIAAVMKAVRREPSG